jgi:hypothetical protein
MMNFLLLDKVGIIKVSDDRIMTGCTSLSRSMYCEDYVSLYVIIFLILKHFNACRCNLVYCVFCTCKAILISIYVDTSKYIHTKLSKFSKRTICMANARKPMYVP